MKSIGSGLPIGSAGGLLILAGGNESGNQHGGDGAANKAQSGQYKHSQGGAGRLVKLIKQDPEAGDGIGKILKKDNQNYDKDQNSPAK